MGEFLIGWSEADITPPVDKFVALAGQYYDRLTRDVHSRLKTVAAAFSSESGHFLTASIDNVGINEPFQRLVREAVAALEPEIRTDQVFLNAIHTHNAPSIKTVESGSRSGGSGDNPEVLSSREYVEYAVPIIAGNLVNAWRRRRPGGIARAFGSARIGHCRRAVFSGSAEMYGDTTRNDFSGMEGGEDSGVEMLFTFDASGRRTGMFLNVACPSQVMEATYRISSDFAGAARELLKAEYGPDFHTIYQISPAGCQSPRDLVRHYATEPDFWHEDGVAELAARLLEAVRRAEPGPVDYVPVFRQTVRRVTLPRRRVSGAEVAAARAELDRLTAIRPEAAAFADFCARIHEREAAGGPGPYDSKLHDFVLIRNAMAVLLRAEDQDPEPDIAFDLHVIRLGEAAMATNPFELYLSYGQIIKARSRAAQTLLIQLAGGASRHVGYLPSPEAERLGGYGGLVNNGQVGSDGGFRLVEITVEEINRLFS